MTDHISPHDPKRHEPTLVNDSRQDHANQKTESIAGQDDRLRHERRDERGYIRVTLPFRVDLDDSGPELAGNDVSLGGFSAHGSRAFEPGDRISGSLRIMAGATELIVPFRAICLRTNAAANGDGYDHGFEITDIEPQHRELLRQIIRSALSGRAPNVEGLLAGEDPQTPRKRQATRPLPPARPPKPRGRYLLLFAAIGVLLVVSAATAYRNFMLIEPSFAAVTAPRIDVRAPGPGLLGDHELTAGDQVERDQLLTNVINSDLESDLILAEAALDYNNRLIENLREHLDGGMQEVSLANSAQPASGDTMTFESVSPQIAQARIEQFETVRDYENSRIAALEARAASNDIYSPCDCLVAWALSSADGVYINESERIMTLIRTAEDDVLVEALVHMDDIHRIEPNQQAYVTLANANQPIRARVRNVALDVERQPRAGFPDWVRQQQNVASVLLIPEEPLPADNVGMPVDVRFAEAPLLTAVSERIWQGVNSIAQLGGNAYRSVMEDDDEITNES